jgi:hypothetical protein
MLCPCLAEFSRAPVLGPNQPLCNRLSLDPTATHGCMNAMAMKASFSPIQEPGPLVDYKEISRTCLPRLGC